MEIQRYKSWQRIRSYVREDERLLSICEFETFLVLLGQLTAGERAIERPGGVFAVTDLRILIVQDNFTCTSIAHPDVVRVLTEKRFPFRLSAFIDAGPLGQIGLLGRRGGMRKAVRAMVPLAGAPIREQPKSRLTPLPPHGPLVCAECGGWQQDEWNVSPDFCHMCLRHFEWTAEHAKMVAEFREWVDNGKPSIAASLWAWIKAENPEFARKVADQRYGLDSAVSESGAIDSSSLPQMPARTGRLRRLVRLVWHGGKLFVAGSVFLLLAVGFVYGAFFADAGEDSDPNDQPVPVVGDCIAADRDQPIAVPCEDPNATVQVVQVIDGDSMSQCALVPGVTGALQHKSVLKVGGADGVDVSNAEVRTLCVKDIAVG
ncbi:hypothetical protein F9278_21770 [Streptomyces phaeolivaceus]|uniref:Uncharacterized protein n=1 Tax=Streptomyces phaeolivaceus TaxID=2653200 RepID=A0A5P8K5V3_9ACTN|nr:hypothetical protein [Streptomyces phaeolivaceus]QFQ98376.1 hypothetical protein F9278_21770 [Streptomyces phaeolivaceus]